MRIGASFSPSFITHTPQLPMATTQLTYQFHALHQAAAKVGAGREFILHMSCSELSYISSSS